MAKRPSAVGGGGRLAPPSMYRAMVSRSSAGPPGYAEPACAGSRTGCAANSRRRSACHARELLVFQKAGVAERLDQMLLDARPHPDRPVMPHQRGTQVQSVWLAVEALQALHQQRAE